MLTVGKPESSLLLALQKEKRFQGRVHLAVVPSHMAGIIVDTPSCLSSDTWCWALDLLGEGRSRVPPPWAGHKDA